MDVFANSYFGSESLSLPWEHYWSISHIFLRHFNPISIVAFSDFLTSVCG